MSLINKRIEKQLRERLQQQAAKEAQRGDGHAWNSANTPYVPTTSTRERLANELQLSFIDVDDWIEKQLRDKKRFFQVT